MTETWREKVAERGWALELPLLCETEGRVRGRLKGRPEHFIVEEIPAYLPSGEGEHLFLQVRKTDCTTEDVVWMLADAFHVDSRDVGMAGLKDRYAVATQWLSVLFRGDESRGLQSFESNGGVEVLQVTRHSNKLRTSHLKENRFDIVLDALQGEVDEEALARRVERLSTVGFPNYFGSQRFGFDGANVTQGLRVLAGRFRAKGRKRRLLISAVQSAVFNCVLAERLVGDGVDCVQVGDVLQRVESGGCFLCTEDALADARRRFELGELVLTGPIPGEKMLSTEGRPLELERAAARQIGVTWGRVEGDEGLLPMEAGGKLANGSRRPLVVRPRGLGYQRIEGKLRFRFGLPPGCYATELLRGMVEPSPGPT